MRSVLEPVVTSVVILRDKTEQDRFVVRWVGVRGGVVGRRAGGGQNGPALCSVLSLLA
jgi:hypothetical protein